MGFCPSVRQVAGVTTLHITHNRSEAIRLADVVLLWRLARYAGSLPRS